MKTSNVVIIHGAYGYPEENWFGWLKRELKHCGIECHVPHLPTPIGQNLENWLELFNQSYKNWIQTPTIMIGHSLGAAFALRWLETHDNVLDALILVGAFTGNIGVEKFDSINQSFFTAPFNWKHIQKQCRRLFCYYGTNDVYVSKNNFECIADNLKARKMIISNAGHFNTASGYSQFPHLLMQLKQLIGDN